MIYHLFRPEFELRPELLLLELDLLPDDPELRLGLEKLLLPPEEDLLLLTREVEDLLPDDLLVLLEERTFVPFFDEDPLRVLLFAIRRFDLDVLGLLNDF
jgi:hypothetical protein